MEFMLDRCHGSAECLAAKHTASALCTYLADAVVPVLMRSASSHLLMLARQVSAVTSAVCTSVEGTLAVTPAAAAAGTAFGALRICSDRTTGALLGVSVSMSRSNDVS